MFANGTDDKSTTQHHGYPLPPEGRGYRPTYSRGQYVLPDPETGKKSTFTRVTTGAHTLDDTSNLDRWKMGNVVLGLKEKPELLDSLDLWQDPTDVRRQVRSIADQASVAAGANQASELGTAIHAWTEAVERDGMAVDDVPDQLRPYVAAYVAKLEDYGITTVPDMVERIVYNPQTGWVGTFDRIYQLSDGTRVIGDVKTSKTLRYGYLGFSQQLASYAHAAYMLSSDGTQWEPMPAVSDCFGLIAHVPSDQPGTCDLVTIDLSAGMEALELSHRIIMARRNAGAAIPGKWDLPRPVDIPALISQAVSAEQLAKLFDDHQDVWTDDYTQLGYKRMSELGLA